MKNRDAFSSCHPIINFLFFTLVLLFSMCLMHPAYLAISLTGALTYDIYLKGRKAVRFAVMGLFPMAAVAALVNPAFNHEGQTILTYLPSGNPLTLESMLYGAAAAVMLASVVLWFSGYNEVMTSDKFVYLFGRVIPALSLVLPKRRRVLAEIRKTAACSAVSETLSKSSPSWSHGVWRMPLRRQIPCVLAAMVCRDALRSLSIALTIETRRCWRG